MKYGIPERRGAIILKTLAPYRSLSFDDAAAEHYAQLRHKWLIEWDILNPDGTLRRYPMDHVPLGPWN